MKVQGRVREKDTPTTQSSVLLRVGLLVVLLSSSSMAVVR